MLLSAMERVFFSTKKKKNRRFCSCFIHIGTKHVHNTPRHIQTHTKRKNEQFQSTQYLIVFRISFISIIDTKQTKQNGTKRANNKRWYAQLIFQFSLFLNFFVLCLFSTLDVMLCIHTLNEYTQLVFGGCYSLSRITHISVCLVNNFILFSFILCRPHTNSSAVCISLYKVVCHRSLLQLEK